ncbi:hypothetical protein CLU96_1526 [Chryseobacterium sp. 52]|nr:hypothetical protein CLU96_1526 [Chryseobacterium sp. 52]
MYKNYQTAQKTDNGFCRRDFYLSTSSFTGSP